MACPKRLPEETHAEYAARRRTETEADHQRRGKVLHDGGRWQQNTTVNRRTGGIEVRHVVVGGKGTYVKPQKRG